MENITQVIVLYILLRDVNSKSLTLLDGETLVKRKAWLKHWNENSNELDTEWSDLAVLIELNNINDFFESDYKRSNKENLEQFVKNIQISMV